MAECEDCNNNNNECTDCTDGGLTINDICNPVECETPQCTESFEAGCIIYTDVDIVCDGTVLVTSGATMAQAMANITAYFCTQKVVDADIVCGTDTVVNQDTSINDALDQIVAYFCNQLSSTIVWEAVALDPHSIVDTKNQGLIINTNSIDFDLPATATLGRTVIIVGTNQLSNHTVTHATAGVSIVSGASSTTAGAGGSLTIDKEDTIELTYIGSDTWAVTRHHSPSGNPLVFV